MISLNTLDTHWIGEVLTQIPTEGRKLVVSILEKVSVCLKILESESESCNDLNKKKQKTSLLVT